MIKKSITTLFSRKSTEWIGNRIGIVKDMSKPPALSLSAVNSEEKQGVGQCYLFDLICHCYRERSSSGEDEASLRVCGTLALQKPSYRSKVIEIPGRSMSPPMDRQVVSNYVNCTAVWSLVLDVSVCTRESAAIDLSRLI